MDYSIVNLIWNGRLMFYELEPLRANSVMATGFLESKGSILP